MTTQETIVNLENEEAEERYIPEVEVDRDTRFSSLSLAGSRPVGSTKEEGIDTEILFMNKCNWFAQIKRTDAVINGNVHSRLSVLT